MKATTINLIPNTTNPTPDYYCTWQTQLYATCDGKPSEQRKAICEKSLFDTEKPYGWAYFYEQARNDLLFIMDDSWDVPLNNDTAYYGSLSLNEEKFPTFTKNTDNALKPLVEKMKSLGWKGLGGWVCAQESPVFFNGKSVEEYWIERLKAMNDAGFSYWKVDWGNKSESHEFRKMLTDLARVYAPDLIVEHAVIPNIIPHCDTFRTYDVPAILSIPMTLEKLVTCSNVPQPIGENKGLINCEDEAYVAAAGGYAMGIMRHPYSGAFTDGRADMSFPEIHRNLKTKLYEVIRATRWHRMAPAFGGGNFTASETTLSDTWKFEKIEEELENWWLGNPLICEYMNGNVLTKSAPAAVARNTPLPTVMPDANGNVPYCVASRNPNGVYSVVTLGRTMGRTYHIPQCDVTVYPEDAHTIGVFGEYNTLSLQTNVTCKRILAQDIAGTTAWDITEHVIKEPGKITIPGEWISLIGTLAQPQHDTSEPGVVLALID